MDRYWEANAISTAPPVPASSSGGYPTDGSPTMATPPTTPGAWWYHAITEEIRNAIVKLGGTPNFSQVDQLANAIIDSITNAINGVTANLAKVAYSGSYTDLSNKPTIPAAQVNSDWNASSGVAAILNKPALAKVATSGNYTDLSNKPDLSVYATNASLDSSVQNLQAQVDGKQASGNYVKGADGHGYALTWTSNRARLSVDSTDQGALYSDTWYQPMTLGGVGNVIIIGSSLAAGQTIANPTVRPSGPTLSGTWLSCGQFSSGSDQFSLCVRVS